MQQLETNPEYSIGRLLLLAHLLTGNQTFLVKDENEIRILLNLLPGTELRCRDDDRRGIPYVDLLKRLRPADGISEPEYGGEDPVQDIITVLRQLAACQQDVNPGFGSRIIQLFTGDDVTSSSALRELLLLSKVVIELLSLWLVLKDNGVLNEDQYHGLRKFGVSALERRGIANADLSVLGEDELVVKINRAQQWNGDFSSIYATFSVGDINPSPVLLPFAPRALDSVMQMLVVRGGILPPQISQSEGRALKRNPFEAAKTLREFIEGYISSGAVKPALSY